MIINPFITSGYVAPEYFCDREKETETLLRWLTNGNHVAIMSTRRMGKTGLIEHCFRQDEISGKYYTFLVDIYATKTLRDFVFRLGKSILDTLKPQKKQVWEKFITCLSSLRSSISFDSAGMPSWNLELGDIHAPAVTLDEIFKYLNEADKPCIVAIDEFQQVINYPAIAEHDESHRKTGEPLHAERYPLEALNRIRAAVGERDWAALYQQHPVPDGGGLFKEQWIQYYRQADLPSKFDKLVTSWDMTFKDGAGSDYVVGQVWGRAGAKFYLLDQVRGQMDFVKTKAAFVALAEKWPHAVRKLVEDKANGPAIISELRDKVAGIIPITPKESKEARAYAVSTLWEAHNVYIPDPQEIKWVGRDFIPELLSFPAGAHDDQVDAMTQALNDLKVGRMRMDPSNLKYLGF